MQKLFNAVTARMRDASEAHRLIEREKLILDENKIVALVELDRWNLEHRETILGRAFNDCYQEFTLNAFELGKLFFVPENKLEPATVERLKAWRTQGIDVSKDHAAMCFSDVIDCWSSVLRDNSFWRKTQDESFLKGEGDQVVSFWRHVNALQDYSGLFPEQKPRGGKRERTTQGQRLRGLILQPDMT